MHFPAICIIPSAFLHLGIVTVVRIYFFLHAIAEIHFILAVCKIKLRLKPQLKFRIGSLVELYQILIRCIQLQRKGFSVRGNGELIIFHNIFYPADIHRDIDQTASAYCSNSRRKSVGHHCRITDKLQLLFLLEDELHIVGFFRLHRLPLIAGNGNILAFHQRIRDEFFQVRADFRRIRDPLRNRRRRNIHFVAGALLRSCIRRLLHFLCNRIRITSFSRRHI